MKKKMRKRNIIIIFISVCILISLGIQFITPRNDKQLENQLRKSILKAINFLNNNQLPYGEFKTFYSYDLNMSGNCYYESSPFITSFVVYSIGLIDNKKCQIMIDKSLKFFIEEMEDNGIWRFWTSRSKKNIPPDLDDISCISFILRKYGIISLSNYEIFKDNRNKYGLYNTWVGGKEEIDCIVNANVLLYLGQREETKNVCNYLNYIILYDKEDNCILYYLNKISLYYMVSRAYFNDVSYLVSSKEKIINKILSMQKRDGSFENELYTALAICTLLNFKYDSPKINSSINYLIKTQEENGSWKRCGFFLEPPSKYYGSEELTTAICLEAISRYYNLINSN